MERNPAQARLALEQQLWRCIEAVHAVVYFAPQARGAFEQLGLRGFWMGYFASRAAPLGPASAELVSALFHGFAPRMVARALPDAWARATPHDILTARADLAHEALIASVGDLDVRYLADVLDQLVDRLDLAGRPLAAAHATTRPPVEPLTRLWHLTGVLREYRGDGHVAALVAADVDGVQSHVWHAAGGLLPEQQREYRGWTEQEWQAARETLRTRGWLDRTGSATPTGTRARADVERRTDAAAARALVPLLDTDLHELCAGLAPLAAAVVRSGAVPYPNPIGVPAPVLPGSR